jgi:hypothetical protein
MREFWGAKMFDRGRRMNDPSPTRQFFRPNLAAKGRWVRGGMGLLLLLGSGALLLAGWLVPGALLLLGGVFTIVEALRGWCVLRACGLKTRL